MYTRSSPPGRGPTSCRSEIGPSDIGALDTTARSADTLVQWYDQYSRDGVRPRVRGAGGRGRGVRQSPDPGRAGRRDLPGAAVSVVPQAAGVGRGGAAARSSAGAQQDRIPGQRPRHRSAGRHRRVHPLRDRRRHDRPGGEACRRGARREGEPGAGVRDGRRQPRGRRRLREGAPDLHGGAGLHGSDLVGRDQLPRPRRREVLAEIAAAGSLRQAVSEESRALAAPRGGPPEISVGQRRQRHSRLPHETPRGARRVLGQGRRHVSAPQPPPDGGSVPRPLHDRQPLGRDEPARHLPGRRLAARRRSDDGAAGVCGQAADQGSGGD